MQIAEEISWWFYLIIRQRSVNIVQFHINIIHQTAKGGLYFFLHLRVFRNISGCANECEQALLAPLFKKMIKFRLVLAIDFAYLPPDPVPIHRAFEGPFSDYDHYLHRISGFYRCIKPVNLERVDEEGKALFKEPVYRLFPE